MNPLDLSPQYASVITGVGRIGTIGAILSTFVASQVVQDHVSQSSCLFGCPFVRALFAAVVHYSE